MANSFVLIAQQPLEFHGRDYQPGERFVADWSESPALKRSGQAVLAPEEEQRAHGTTPREPIVTPRRPRVRTRTVVPEESKPASEDAPPKRRYRRRDLEAEEA